jgi:6-phosphogluconolactonase
MKQRIYVGTYTMPITFGTGEILKGKGKGIYLYEFDPDTAELKLTCVTEWVDNPSYIAIDSKAGKLYAVNELKEYNSERSGAVSAFDIRADGSLKLINMQATGGTDPCHAALSPDGKRLVVSNFMSGSVSVYPVLKDGSLGAAEQFIQYEGRGAHPERQAGPHAHSAVFSKDSQFAYVCDFGTDSVKAYRYGDAGHLSDKGITDYAAAPGNGLRYAEFGPDGRYCYIISEMRCCVTVTEYDSKTGALSEIQTISAIPECTDSGGNLSADLHVTPDGRFLYASNRGLDNIAMYRINNETGLLSLIGFEPCGGRTPRNFTIDATGKFLLCANQDSDKVTVFSIDKQTGRLTERSKVFAPTPVCVKPF